MTAATWVFALFGIATQAILTAFFAARRWAPGLARPLGVAAYSAGVAGLAVGVWLLAGGEGWRLWAGPLLLAGWAAFGIVVDLWRKVEWRDPALARVLVPYFILYFFAQMFLWWPLWDFARSAWVVFTVLFVANTALNLAGHVGSARGRRT